MANQQALIVVNGGNFVFSKYQIRAMKNIYVLLILFAPFYSWCQESIEKTYGQGSTSEAANDLIVVGGHVYSLGSAYNPDNQSNDFFLIKTDLDGNEIWNRYYGGTLNQFGNAMIALSDGLLLVGQSNVGDHDDGFIIKTDFDGNELWSNTYGDIEDDRFYAAAINAAGKVVLAGVKDNLDTGDKAWFVEINPATANVVVEAEFGNGAANKITDIESSRTDNGWIATGALSTYFSVFKLSESLQDIVWLLNDQEFLATSNNFFSKLSVSDEGKIVVGYNLPAPRFATIDAQGTEMIQYDIDGLGAYTVYDLAWKSEDNFLLTLSPSSSFYLYDGTYLQERNFGNGSLVEDFQFADIDRINVINPEGEQCYLGGFTSRIEGGQDAYTAMIGENNTLAWENLTGVSGLRGTEISHAITQDDDGFYYLLETYQESAGNNDLAVLKVSETGDLIWRTAINHPLNERGYSIKFTSDQHLAILNYQFDEGVTGNIQIIKMDLSGNVVWEVSEPYTSVNGFRGNIVERPNGNLIAGGAMLYGDIFIQEVTSDGQLVSASTITPDNPINFQIYDMVAAGDDDNLILCGRSSLANIFQKYTPEGNLIWETSLDIGPFSRVYDLAIADNGDIFGYGFYISYDNLSDYSGALFHLSPQGDSLGFYAIPSIGEEYDVLAPYSATFDQNENLLVADYQTPSSPQPTDFLLSSKYRARVQLLEKNGNVRWEQVFDTGIQPLFIEAIPTTSGGYAIVGTTFIDNSVDSYLVIISADGTVSTDTPIRPAINWNLFPNPASEQLQFELLLPQQQGELEISLRNLQGQPLWQGNAVPNQKHTLDIQHLPAGMYILDVVLDGTRHAVHWIKE
jgi:hypothetical protein